MFLFHTFQAFYALRGRARQAYNDQLMYLRGTGGGESKEVEDLVVNAVYARCLRITGTTTATGNLEVPSSLHVSRPDEFSENQFVFP